MALKLQLPESRSLPPPEVTELLGPYDLGEILDSGPVRSKWSTGQVVLTAPGIVVCDPETTEVIGIRWDSVNAGDFSSFAVDESVTISLASADGPSIDLTIGGKLACNMGYFVQKLSDIDQEELSELSVVGGLEAERTPPPPPPPRLGVDVVVRRPNRPAPPGAGLGA